MILATTSNKSARHATIPPTTAPNKTDSPVEVLASVLIADADVVSRTINVVLFSWLKLSLVCSGKGKGAKYFM